MSSSRGLVILILASATLLSTINAQSSLLCDKRFSFDTREIKKVTKCQKLGILSAELGWNYDTINGSKTIHILYGAQLNDDQGWVAWGLNPTPRPQMVGTRAFILIKQPNGTMMLNTYNITMFTKMGCELEPSGIEPRYQIHHIDYRADTRFLSMSLAIILPSQYNIFNLNHVWQVGSNVDDDHPKKHATTLQNFDSTETINLENGARRSAGHRRRRLRAVHGILNIIGWGTLLPVGAIFARYFRSFPVRVDDWFKLHVGCQITGFAVGTMGWGIGLYLGKASKQYSFKIHRILGIFIFSLATLQMSSLWLRPKSDDKYRKYWNIYHHFVGYALIVLIAVNLFQGIEIFRPYKNWKVVYFGVLGVLASLILVLEAVTWIKFFIQKAWERKI